jgi:hypothetical protein
VSDGQHTRALPLRLHRQRADRSAGLLGRDQQLLLFGRGDGTGDSQGESAGQRNNAGKGSNLRQVLLSWTFWGTFDVMGVLCDNYYSLEGGVNNLNSFSVAHKDKRFVAMSRAGEGAFNATLLWQFTSGFDLAPPDPSLRALPSFCKSSCSGKPN